MNIAHIGAKAFPARAGADHAVEAIVRRLAGRHTLTVYCSGRDSAPDVAHPSVNLVRVPALSGKHAHAASLFCAAALRACIQGNFDLVHLHNVEACFVLPFLKARCPVIATSQGRAYLVDKWGPLARRLIRATEWAYIYLADEATAVSQSLARYYAQRYGRTVHYVPNGVAVEAGDVDTGAARALLQTYRVDAGRYLLFAAGRILPTKGIETLLAAYRALATALPLLVVGDTTHMHGYGERLRHLAGEHVVFLPLLGRSTLLGLIKLAHLFIFPSTLEAMSMMLLEAAAVGAPIVASDIVDNTSVLPQRALFFAHGDAGDLRDKLRWALDHPGHMQALGAQGRAWVRDTYAWDDVVAQYERLYHRTCAAGN